MRLWLDTLVAFSTRPEDDQILAQLRGEGGVQPQKNKFLSFVICCSPSFCVSKMGSFVSQLQAVVEI